MNLLYNNVMNETQNLTTKEKGILVYPNAQHVKRKAEMNYTITSETIKKQQVELTPLEKFEMFFKEVKGSELTNKQKEIIYEVMEDILLDEREVRKEVK